MIVIIIGISISLYAGKRLEDRKEEQAQLRILENLQQALANDTVKLSVERDFLQRCSELFQGIQTGDVVANPDSAATHLGMMLVYTTSEVNTTTYEEMKFSSGFGLIENKELLQQIIDHYQSSLLLLTEYNSIDKHFILNRMIPFFENNFTLYSSPTLPEVGSRDEIEKLYNNPQFKNLLQTNLIFKINTVAILNAYIASADSLITAIQKEIKERS